jgi:O-antigen/teichoic acid export membrane protein
LLRATLTLLAGGALAQALPLLLGPLLTRLYTPQEFGLYHLFAAVAANVAVVACGRYEFALPLAADEGEAQALRTLCLRLGLLVSLAAALGGAAWAALRGEAWPLALGAAVAALGAVSLATLWATRTQQFRRLAVARVLQHGGGAVGQAVAGWAQGGVTAGGVMGGLMGLIGAPIAAALLTAAWLRLPWRGAVVPASDLRTVARRYRQFPLLNTPHAFAGALQDTLALAVLAAALGPAAAGFWSLALRYLKAPATLVGGAVSQALYPQLATAGLAGQGSPHRHDSHARQCVVTAASRGAVRRVMWALTAVAAPLVATLWWAGPWLFMQLFGPAWADAGVLARALALYIGLHFVASPLAVVTMAWGAQAWALKLALVGQAVFVAALALGVHLGGLAGAGWAVSAAMAGYFGFYFVALARWPLTADTDTDIAPSAGASI